MAGEPSFSEASALGVAFWLSFAAWFCYVTALALRERGDEGDAGTNRMLLLTTVGGLLLAFVAALTVEATTIRLRPLSITGLVVVWAGLALGEWGRLSLGRHYHPVVAVQRGQTVVDGGPYRVIRHPIYAARMLCLVGFGVAMGNWLSIASCTAVPLLGFMARIRVEEAAMLGAAGDEYATYCERTWRLLPLVW